MAPITRPTSVTSTQVQPVRKDSGAGSNGLQKVLAQYTAQGGTVGQRSTSQRNVVTSAQQTRDNVNLSLSLSDSKDIWVVYLQASTTMDWEKLQDVHGAEIAKAGAAPINSVQIAPHIPLRSGEIAFPVHSMNAETAAQFINDMMETGEVNPHISVQKLLELNGLTGALTVSSNGEVKPIQIALVAKPLPTAKFGPTSLFATQSGSWYQSPLHSGKPYVRLSYNSEVKAKLGATGINVSASGYATQDAAGGSGLSGGTLDFTFNPSTLPGSANKLLVKNLTKSAQGLADQIVDRILPPVVPGFIKTPLKDLVKLGVEKQLGSLSLDLPGLLKGIENPTSAIGELGKNFTITISLDASAVAFAVKGFLEDPTKSVEKR